MPEGSEGEPRASSLDAGVSPETMEGRRPPVAAPAAQEDPRLSVSVRRWPSLFDKGLKGLRRSTWFLMFVVVRVFNSKSKSKSNSRTTRNRNYKNSNSSSSNRSNSNGGSRHSNGRSKSNNHSSKSTKSSSSIIHFRSMPSLRLQFLQALVRLLQPFIAFVSLLSVHPTRMQTPV